MVSKQEITRRAWDAARRVDMEQVAGLCGLTVGKIGSQVSVWPCPWCGKGKGHAFIFTAKDGRRKVFCQACRCGDGHAQDAIALRAHMTGDEDRVVVADLAEMAGAISSEEAAVLRGEAPTLRPAQARRPAAVLPMAEPEPTVVEPAPLQVRSDLYTAALRVTGLSDAHRRHLLEVRGVQPWRLGAYADWPLSPLRACLQAARDSLPSERYAALEEALTRVPGVVVDAGGPRWKRGPRSGICIATEVPDGLYLYDAFTYGARRPPIAGLQIRSDAPRDPSLRYFWLSGAERELPGCSVGTPAGVILPGGEPYRDLAITEGAFKAETLARFHCIAVTVAGVGNWRPAMGIVDRFDYMRAVYIAYDADAMTKPEVQRHLRELGAELEARGKKVIVMFWPAEAGKGIDDVEAAGRWRDVKTLPLAEYVERYDAGTLWGASEKPEAQAKKEDTMDAMQWTLSARYVKTDWHDEESGEARIVVQSPGTGRELDPWQAMLDEARVRWEEEKGRPVWPVKGGGIRAAVRTHAVPFLSPRVVMKIDVRATEEGLEVTGWHFATKEELEQVFGRAGQTAEDVLGPDEYRFVKAATANAAASVPLCEMMRKAGIPAAYAARAMKVHGPKAYDRFCKDPYRAGQACGLDFPRADRIARALGIEVRLIDRLRAAAPCATEYAKDCGHTTPPVSLVQEKFERLLGCPGMPLPVGALGRLEKTADGTMVIIDADAEAWERGVAMNAARLRSVGMPERPMTPAMWTAAEAVMVLDFDQREAVESLLTHRGLSLLTGGPGTGKTTVLKAALAAYTTACPSARIRLCSPTGRAAQVMSEVTGMQASTIHSLLELKPFGEGKYYGKSLHDPLEADLVVVDEASMIDAELMCKLLDAIPNGADCWLIGDPDQLPPVGAGECLHDMLAAGRGIAAVSELTTVHRQAKGSAIVDAAHAIRAGRVPECGSGFGVRRYSRPEEVAQKAIKTAVACWKSEDPYAVQVLAPSRKGDAGCDKLNSDLQALVNPPRDGEQVLMYGQREFRLRDKVVLCKNDSALGVCNGDLGIVVGIYDGGGAVTVELRRGEVVELPRDYLPDLKLAYAMTIHKSQGGQWPTVVVVLPSEQTGMTTRSLLYTAVTRAQERGCVLTDGTALEKAVETPGRGVRRTQLQKFLAEELEKAKRKERRIRRYAA